MSNCSKCLGKGTIIVVDPDTGQQLVDVCSCKVQLVQDDLWSMRLRSSKIPKNYWNHSFNSYIKLPLLSGNVVLSDATAVAANRRSTASYNSKSFEYLKDFFTDNESYNKSPNVLWIWGNEPNTGHTSLACCVGMELLKQGKRVHFSSMEEIRMKIMDFDNPEHMKKLRNGIKKVDVFILDDALDVNRVFISQKSTFDTNHLYSFVKILFEEDKKIICTSNRDLFQIKDTFSSIAQLLMRSCKLLEVKGSLNAYLKQLSDKR